MNTRTLLLALLLGGCSCDGTVGIDDLDAAADFGSDESTPDARTDAPDVPGLLSIRIDPDRRTVVDDGAAPFETVEYHAFGTFADGERDITDDVAWILEDPAMGTVERGVVTTAGVGGSTRVIALAGGDEASAELFVRLEYVVVGGEETPADAPTLFPRDTSGDLEEDAPVIVYPSHETMFPRNLERVNHQWESDHALFELRFESEFALVRFYTTGDALQPPLADWRRISETHAGRELTLSVRSIDEDGVVHGSAPITLFYSPAEVQGALYYWSTGAQGVMRATIASPIATKFYSDPMSDEDQCVACHTVSRNGRRMSMGYGGETLRQISVPEREVQIPSSPDDEERRYGWGTFDPPATRLLFAARGGLTLLDADTGAELPGPTLPEGWGVTHPDWSPDGRSIAVTYHSDEDVKDKNVSGTGIARIPVADDGTFGVPEILLPSGGEHTLFFPSYSPDSRWIAFVQSDGGSKDEATSTLYLLAADGSGATHELHRLNRRVRELDGVLDVGNSMPTWAPTSRPGIFWLAFSSIRPYGHLLPGGGRDQLWGAAIDPAEIGRSDASYSAFWMPFQELEEGNHRAFWAVDTEMECPEEVELCDDVDNDCDAIVDEECCTPRPEICDNGIDDDCDGEADEGCGCGDTEICGNGIDDDCDTRVDGEDEDCLI